MVITAKEKGDVSWLGVRDKRFRILVRLKLDSDDSPGQYSSYLPFLIVSPSSILSPFITLRYHIPSALFDSYIHI